MARFPKIERACPLAADAQRRIERDCAQCGHTVHDLAPLDDAARVALLAGLRGPACVKYRLPHAAARLGVALAVGVLATDVAAAPATTASAAAAAPLELDDDIMIGGIDDPHAAQWFDADDRPELPMQREDAAAVPPPDAAATLKARR
ncbi:MAG TPA: hypothetical protein VGC30_08300 [Dokdonella sp.]